jgi:quercetin dioxygenase-like cupin family protein
MPTVKKIEPFFTDERGQMSHLIDRTVVINSAVLITSKKGAVRANHYHKKDEHYSYLLEGKMNYYYKSLGKSEIKKIIVHKGEMVYTPAGEIHAMEFTEDSLFIALATEKRSSTEYEEDTIRIKII